MPEGDTIHRTASVLHAALAGHVVTRFETAYAHLARVDDDGAIAGRVVERVEARGKHVLLVLSGGLVLRTHMRMHGAGTSTNRASAGVCRPVRYVSGSRRPPGPRLR